MTNTTVENTTYTTIEYWSDSTMIFEGFYESNLWNSDSLYWDTANDREEGYLKPNQEYDLLEWDNYRREACRDVEVLLYEEGINHNDKIVNNISFIKIISPKEYNFMVDKFVADVEVDIDRLHKYCLEDNKDNFGKYLKEKYTSYDGYVSFMPNNITEFIDRIDECDRRCDNIMLDYYFLSNIYDDKDVVKCINEEHTNTTYHHRLYEYARENLFNYRDIVYSDETRYHKSGSIVPVWDRAVPYFVKLTNKEKLKIFIDKCKFYITFELNKLK